MPLLILALDLMTGCASGSVSLLPYVSTACMFAKLANLVLFFYCDVVYGLVFAVVSLVHLLVLPEPVYQGPENVLYFAAEELERELALDKRVTWLIELYAAWNPASVDFASSFAELSNRCVSSSSSSLTPFACTAILWRTCASAKLTSRAVRLWRPSIASTPLS